MISVVERKDAFSIQLATDEIAAGWWGEFCFWCYHLFSSSTGVSSSLVLEIFPSLPSSLRKTCLRKKTRCFLLELTDSSAQSRAGHGEGCEFQAQPVTTQTAGPADPRVRILRRVSSAQKQGLLTTKRTRGPQRRGVSEQNPLRFDEQMHRKATSKCILRVNAPFQALSFRADRLAGQSNGFLRRLQGL